MTVTVRQVSIGTNPESTFYLKIEWASDLGAGFILLLCDGVSAWSGEVSEEDVTREANELKIQRDRYVNDMRRALIGEGTDAQSYTFHLTPQGAEADTAVRLSYEKVQHDMAFTIGCIELLPVLDPTKVIRELISYGLKLSVRLQTEQRNLHEENQRLRDMQTHMSAEMERYIEEKESLERDLYGRFVLILNQKKCKMRGLQEQIRELQEAAEAEKQSGVKAGGSHRERTDNMSANESDYGDATDEETNEEISPSLLNSTAHNPKSDRLSDVADVAPSRKRRQRHLHPSESQNKKQAVQPRQSSGCAQTTEAKAPAPAQLSPDQLFEDF